MEALTGRGHHHVAARHRFDVHWVRSIGFTMFLVGLIAIATDADWVVTLASVGTSAIGFGVFYLFFPGGWHFGIVTANFLAIYACFFEYFLHANFAGAPRPAIVTGLALPVIGFLGTCLARRYSITRVIHARRLRELSRLPKLSRWLFASMVVGAASFALPHSGADPTMQGLVLIGAMGIITICVMVAIHDVVLLMVDISMVFEMVAGRMDRLLMPVIAFLTVYALLVIVFACFFRIADMTTPMPQFLVLGEARRISFVEAVYFSSVTITTLGFGDISPISMLVRALTAIEVICGVLMLLFGFSEVMRSAGPDSDLHGKPHRRDSARDSP